MGTGTITLCRVPLRPNMTLSVKRLMREVAARLPELAHVRASRVLVVAGEARGTSRASIRPGSVGSAGAGRRRRFIRVRGRRVLYVMTLRPLWFAASTAEERIATILHELYHASTRFDGSLHRGRRHSRLPRAAYDRKIKALLTRYLAVATKDVVAPFARDGVVKVRIWLRVPRVPRRGARGLDVDQHLVQGLMQLRDRTVPRPAPRRRVGPRRRPASSPARLRPAPRGHDEEEGGS